MGGAGEQVYVIGCLRATAVKDCRKCSVNFYVVDKGTALMGMGLISALKLCIKGDKILPDPATASTSCAPEPVLQLSTQVDSVGYAVGFMHKVKVTDSVVPV